MGFLEDDLDEGMRRTRELMSLFKGLSYEHAREAVTSGKCPYCSGTGESLGMMSTQDCSACNGTGKTSEMGTPKINPEPPSVVIMALANLTDAFLKVHGRFPLDRVTDEQRAINDAMKEAYRIIGQPKTNDRKRKMEAYK